MKLIDLYGLKETCRLVIHNYYDKVFTRLVEHEKGYWKEVCVPIPTPTIAIPDIPRPKGTPGFPADISYQLKCFDKWIKTQDAKYETEVEKWMKGYLECTDTCTGEVTKDWFNRRADDIPKVNYL